MLDDGVVKRARELGRLLGQTPEFQALRRARERVEQEQGLRDLLRELAELEKQVVGAVQRGETPSPEVAERYEALFSEVQAHPAYQGMVSAQANFDRILGRVNEEIGQGMEAASASGIIIPA